MSPARRRDAWCGWLRKRNPGRPPSKADIKGHEARPAIGIDEPALAGESSAVPSPSSASHSNIGDGRRNIKLADEPPPSNYEMWVEARDSLEESHKSNIKTLMGEQNREPRDRKFLVTTIQKKISEEFETNKHDSRARVLIKKSISLLNSFATVANVTGGFDPVHAALPWAAVRSSLVVLNAKSELKSQFIVGFAQVAWLLTQCDTYQELYMAQIPELRPPKTTIDTLQQHIIQCYVKSQMFLSYAVEYRDSTMKKAEALFKMEDVRSHINNLEERKRELQETADGCAKQCDLSNRKNVQELLNLAKDLSVDLKALRDAEAALKVAEAAFRDAETAFRDADVKKRHEELLRWLCEIDPSGLYNAAREKHESGTGDWLVRENESFRIWKHSPGSLLWLHGNAGAGKSMLCSSVIKHLKDRCETQPNTELAYYFFSFTDLKKQNVVGMLESIVKQLYVQRPNTPDIAESLTKCKQKGERLDMKTLEKALLSIAGQYLTVFIVVDGLDECPVLNRERAKLLDSLGRIITTIADNTHILLTSRNEPDISAQMGTILSPPERATIDLMEYRACIDHDMKVYIDSAFASSHYCAWPEDLKAEAKSLITEKADGMFQYIYCQIDMLQDLSSDFEIRASLESLPIGLDGTYDRALQSISPKFQAQVLRALTWLAFSKDRITIEQFAEIFILRPDQETPINETERMFEPGNVLKYIPSLVVTYTEYTDPYSSRPDITYARLTHFSVKEYLMSDRIAKGPVASFSVKEPDAHLQIAQSCLSYHIYRSTVDDKRIYALKLRNYAAENWMLHLEMIPRKEWPANVMHMATQALGIQSRSLRISIERYGSCLSYPEIDVFGREWKCYKRVMGMMVQPQCLTAHLGMPQLTDMLLSANQYLTQQDRNEALKDAVLGGNMETVQLLVGRGADVNAEDTELGRPLHLAALNGHVAIMELLLNKGAHVSASEPGMGSPLCWATYNGHKAIVDVLLKSGDDINAQSVELGGPLHIAVSRGNQDQQNSPLRQRHRGYPPARSPYRGSKQMVSFLLAKGADINAQHERLGTALRIAVSEGDIDTARLLVEREADVNLSSHEAACAVVSATDVDSGADVNGDGGDDESSIYTMAERDHFDREQFTLLLDLDADVNARSGKYVYSLQAMCAAGSKYHWERRPEVELLLDRGADINAQGGEYGNALQAACSVQEMDVVQLLVDRGAHINAQGGKHGNALQAACERGRMDMVRLLVERGANVNAQGGKYRTALQALCTNGEVDKDGVQFLLDCGAGVNLQGGEYGNVLQAACYSLQDGDIQEAIVEMLLDRGADVNAEGGKFGNPLQATAASRRLGVKRMKLLLHKGAQVNQQGGPYGNALQAACASHFNFVNKARLLLDNGADIKARGGEWGSAWHAAAAPYLFYWNVISGNDLLELLLNHGADVDETQDLVYPTALHAARTPDRIRFLLDRGANVNLVVGERGSVLQMACAEEKGNQYKNYNEDAETKVRILLENCPDIDIHLQGGLYGSALQAAAHSGQIGSVQMLLVRGADANAPGGEYGSVLVAAVVHDFLGIVKVLLDHGADSNTPSEKYGSALNAATVHGYLSIVEVLLKRGADARVPERKCWNALYAAVVQGFWSIVDLLIKYGAEPSKLLLLTTEEEWLTSIKEECGERGVSRYQKFLQVHDLSE